VSSLAPWGKTAQRRGEWGPKKKFGSWWGDRERGEVNDVEEKRKAWRGEDNIARDLTRTNKSSARGKRGKSTAIKKK